MVKKLRNDRGMSILFSLLILLACGVVASVVLAAATAAAGRMSGTAEADSRYYCVSSAAELLHEVLCEQGGVTVEQGRTTVTVRNSVAAADGTVTEESTADTVYGVKLDGAELLDGMSPTLAQKLALGMIFENGNCGDTDLVQAWEEPLYGQGYADSFIVELRVGDSGDDVLSALAAQVRITREKSGLLTVVVSNRGGADVYSVQMVFAPVTDQRDVRQTHREEPVVLRDEESGTVTETVRSTEVERRITEIRWVMISMEKVSSYDPS